MGDRQTLSDRRPFERNGRTDASLSLVDLQELAPGQDDRFLTRWC